jgi:outer membrane receptor protein involved in Fe transport
VTFDVDPVSVTLIGRGVSSGVWDKAYIECTTGCPRSTVTHPTIDHNRVKGAFYLDTNLQYKLAFGDSEATVFLNVDNVFDKTPPIVPVSGGLLYAGKPTNPNLYDTLGRAFRAGVRFRM